MKPKTPYFSIGLFTLVGIGLAVGAILLFGAGRVLEERIMMETYINESVQGLNIGSAVKLRGVQVGSVQDINFTRNFYELNKPYEERKDYVLVKFELQPKAIGVDGTSKLQLAIRKLAQTGLRVRLASANLTGVAYLEIDISDSTEIENLEYDWNPNHPYIPSTASSISRLVSAVENVFQTLESINLNGVIEKLESTLTTLEQKIADVDSAKISQNTNQLLEDLRETNRQIQIAVQDLDLKNLSGQASMTMSELQNKFSEIDITGILESLNSAMSQIEEISKSVSSNKHSLRATAQNFESLSAGLRILSEQLKSSPASAIFGPAPEKVLKR